MKNKKEITKEQYELFHRNFNKEAYEQAIQPVQDAISNSKGYMELRYALRKYDIDDG